MKLLFLTIGRFESIENHLLYPDLLRCFRDEGHEVYIVSPFEKRIGKATELTRENGAQNLHVKIGNLTKCNIIEKGISTLLVEQQFKRAIDKYFRDVKFDLILYSTPPITFVNIIQLFKKRDGAKSYLLLKDIFPQNAVDLGMMSKNGIKGLIYKFFRNKEKKLYAISDRIGCMSQANVDYVIKHNSDVNPDIVEVFPNCIEPIDMSIDSETRYRIRSKYEIPLDKKVFVYGGNLGKPQGIDFLIDCLKTQKNNKNVFFLIVGDGTEYGKIDAFVSSSKQENVKLMKRLPKEDYDTMVSACDIGMIFLDHRFTIPNFPSRLLSYMQAKIPVLAVTDSNTDIGKVIENGDFGWWCSSNSIQGFCETIQNINSSSLREKGDRAYCFLQENYNVSNIYSKITKILLSDYEEKND